MDEKVLINPSLAGESREEMGMEPFTVTEIRSSIMRISMFISEEQIAWVIRRASEESFVSGLDNNKTSPWNDTVNKTMFNSTKKGKYCDLSVEQKLQLKIQNDNLQPKGGGGDQPALDHRVFLHFFKTKEKANVQQSTGDGCPMEGFSLKSFIKEEFWMLSEHPISQMISNWAQ